MKEPGFYEVKENCGESKKKYRINPVEGLSGILVVIRCFHFISS